MGYEGCYGGDMLCYVKLVMNVLFLLFLGNLFEDEKVYYFGDLEFCDG